MENNKNKKSVKFQGDMLNFCDFIQVFVFTTNHHLKKHNNKEKNRRAIKSNMNTYQNMSKEWEKTENEKKTSFPSTISIYVCKGRQVCIESILYCYYYHDYYLVCKASHILNTKKVRRNMISQ